MVKEGGKTTTGAPLPPTSGPAVGSQHRHQAKHQQQQQQPAGGQQQQKADLGTLQPTSNKTGFDFGQPTFKVEEWIAAYDGQSPLLDLGCGLGTNTCAALEAGASVVAVDPSEEHLRILRERAPKDVVESGRLRTVVGELASRLEQQQPQPAAGDGHTTVTTTPGPSSSDSGHSIPAVPGGEGGGGESSSPSSGVLCTQVLHFLRPSQIPEAFTELANYLKPGGTLVLTCASIYQLPQGLRESTEAQLQSQGPGSFPGWVVDMHETVGEVWSEEGEEVARMMRQAMPRSFHAFHPQQIRFHAECAGLEVKECGLVSGRCVGLPDVLIAPPGSPHAGKDIVYLVATKKNKEGGSSQEKARGGE